jgi:hypothetical protein
MSTQARKATELQVEQLVSVLCWPDRKRQTLDTLLQLSKPEHIGDWVLAYLRALCFRIEGAHAHIGTW